MSVHCEACFVGWREGATSCWQCGNRTTVVKVRPQPMPIDISTLNDMVAAWAQRTRRW